MIRISNLNKIFKNKKRKVTALKDINLSFEETGITFIVGESGAGKTTLLNMLSLQDRSTSGSLVIDNKDVSKLSSKNLATLRSRYFGIVFQKLNLINDFTVYQNIVIGLEIQKIKPSKEEVIKILDYLNMPSELLEEKVYNLSGGQKQRVAIVRALIKNPKALICDEPTGSLDNLNAIELMEILRKIATDKLVIIVSHNMTLANTFGDRIITLKNGSIVSDTKEIDQVEDEEVLLDLKYKRLPFKLILKLALLSLRKSIPRFIMTSIAFILTLSVFMTSMSIYSFNDIKVTEKVLSEEKIDYFHLSKFSKLAMGIPSYFNERDLKKIDSIYENNYIPAHYSSDVAASTSLNIDLSKDRILQRISNIAHLNEENLKNCNFNIIGNLPVPKDDINEIALTKYECYTLGWIEKNEFGNEDKIRDIISNKKYKINFYKDTTASVIVEFKISGIIDTNYTFFNVNDRNYNWLESGQERYEMHKTLFFTQENFAEIMAMSINLGDVHEMAYHNIYIFTKDGLYLRVTQLKELYSGNIFVKENSRVDYIILQCSDFSKIYATFSLIIGIILLIISFLAFVGFIKSSISINRRTMKVLRSLGITIFDCNNVFFLQSALLSLLCVLLAIIPYSITIELINNYFQNQYSTVVSPLNVTFLIILLSFIGLLVLSLLTTFLYSLSAFKRKNLIVKQ